MISQHTLSFPCAFSDIIKLQFISCKVLHFNFFISIQDKILWIKFFPRFSKMSVGDDIIRMNIDGKLGNWQNFKTFNLPSQLFLWILCRTRLKAYAWRPTSDDLIAREKIAAAVPGTPTLAAAAGAGALMLGGPAFFLLRNKGFVKFVFSVPMGWIGGSMTALLVRITNQE